MMLNTSNYAQNLLNRLLDLERWQKRGIVFSIDAMLVVASFVAAMYLRLESFDFLYRPRVWVGIGTALPVGMAAFTALGLYRAVLRFISLRTLKYILFGVSITAVALFLLSQTFALGIPRSVPAIFLLIGFVSLGAVRFCLRMLLMRDMITLKKPVIIYGAGASGRQLLSALQHGREYFPIALVDDDAALHGAEIGGYRVHDPGDIDRLIKRHGVEMVLLALPSASLSKRKAILERLAEFSVRVQTIPGMADIVNGKARINEFADVAVEELLGRDPVEPRQDLMTADISGRVVMVTGAAGSIGSELCRQILGQGPKTLILLDHSESGLYQIDLELNDSYPNLQGHVQVVPVLASVQDGDSIEAVLDRFGVETIYHAAAYKHVPMIEGNVTAGLHNNIFGTFTLAKCAVAAHVRSFILISTDKAVRPTNIMGASKRVAELICQALSASQDHTTFSVVRFGNVLGSSGSVIPRFRTQISEGGPVTVTHKDITRYFMTITEASQLVIQAGAMARGGDVFVLDMGEPMRIVDLAIRMIRLSGLTPQFPDMASSAGQPDPSSGDIAIEFTGLRPGEKLYEELLVGENTSPTEHPRIMTASEPFLAMDDLDHLLEQIRNACRNRDIDTIRAVLQSAATGYVPWSDLDLKSDLELKVAV